MFCYVAMQSKISQCKIYVWQRLLAMVVFCSSKVF